MKFSILYILLDHSRTMEETLTSSSLANQLHSLKTLMIPTPMLGSNKDQSNPIGSGWTGQSLWWVCLPNLSQARPIWLQHVRLSYAKNIYIVFFLGDNGGKWTSLSWQNQTEQLVENNSMSTRVTLQRLEFKQMWIIDSHTP